MRQGMLDSRRLTRRGPAVIDERWFTVEQIAERLQVSEHTVRRWLRDGELVGHNFGGRTGYRVREAEVNTFLARRTGRRPNDPEGQP